MVKLANSEERFAQKKPSEGSAAQNTRVFEEVQVLNFKIPRKMLEMHFSPGIVYGRTRNLLELKKFRFKTFLRSKRVTRKSFASKLQRGRKREKCLKLFFQVLNSSELQNLNSFFVAATFDSKAQAALNEFSRCRRVQHLSRTADRCQRSS